MSFPKLYVYGKITSIEIYTDDTMLKSGGLLWHTSIKGVRTIGGKLKMDKKFSIKEDFTMLAILIIPIAVAVNFVGGQLASMLKLPMYLDTIGTIFAAMLCGPWVGAVAGGLTNIVLGFANPVNFWFIPVNVIVGLTTGWMSRKKWFTKPVMSIVGIVLMAVISTVASAPIVVYVFGGVTGGGTSIITATLMAAGQNIWSAFLSTEGLFTCLDRLISYVISIAVIKVIPSRTLVKFGCGSLYIKEKK